MTGRGFFIYPKKLKVCREAIFANFVLNNKVGLPGQVKVHCRKLPAATEL